MWPFRRAEKEEMRLIVGLGNPGTEYAGTRHNVGFEVIDELADRHKIPVRRRTMRSVIGDGVIDGQKVILARPMTYMNRSGEAVGAIARMYKIGPEDIILIVDDIALPLGKLRLRPKGSAGGHNGLDSVEHHLRTQEYPRIRIGVGSARPGKMVDHVLGKFRPDERETVAFAVDRAADAVETALRDGFEKAMNLYNRDEP
jgi:peptidyl-tRNA hydrolase, PTH1 family